MASFQSDGPCSFKAASSLSAGRVVYLSAAQTVNYAVTSSSAILGVTLDFADSGATVPVETRPGHIAKVYVAANVAAGDVVGPATDGAGGITPRALGTVTSHIPTLGIALEAGSVGSNIEVLLQPVNIRA